MHGMTETQGQEGRVAVALDAEELRALLEYRLNEKLDMEMWEYHTDYTCAHHMGVRAYARVRQAALETIMKPMDVAVAQRDVCVRLWYKATEFSRCGRQPLDLDTVRRIYTENETTLERSSSFYPDPRGYFAYLAPVLLEAAAAQIRHDLSPSCGCGPDVKAKDDEIDLFGCWGPSHRCKDSESLRAVDATLAALAAWNAKPEFANSRP
jgi:hypothetical protein